jgi:1,4-dihydroxy-2-naphthoyl-CoA hydrolase
MPDLALDPPGTDPPPPPPPDFYPPEDIRIGMRALQDALSKGAPQAEILAAANRVAGELNVRMGVQIVECTPDTVAGTMPVLGNRQPFGLLHGGANAVLAESLGSFHASLLAGPGRVPVGIELNCTHHRAMTAGLVYGRSAALHTGRTMMTLEIVISRETGERVCTARLSCLVQPGG